MDLGLRGRSAVITGSSRGIGLAIAQMFASEGCNVHLAATNREKLEDAATDIRRTYAVDATVHAGDLTQRGDLERLGAKCLDVDILVNNAGAIPQGSLTDIDPDRWRRAWDLKLFAFIDLTRIIYPKMVEKKSGVIINIIGMAGETPSASGICVSTANAALRMFTFCLAGDGLHHGVRVVGINPGAVLTDRLKNRARERAQTKFGDPDRWADVFSTLPGGRAAEPSEIASAAAFLASDRAAYINGEILRIDGGLKVDSPGY